MASSSKRVGRSEEIELVDGTPVTLRPLNIKKLKEFMKKFGEIQEIAKDADDFDDQFMDILVDMSAISVSTELKDATAYLYKNKDDDDYEEAREKWEEMVDQDTVAFINEVCGGIKFPGADDEDFQRRDEG